MSWCFKSPATRLFVQQLFRIKTSKFSIAEILWTGGLVMNSNSESISVWWLHHVTVFTNSAPDGSRSRGPAGRAAVEIDPAGWYPTVRQLCCGMQTNSCKDQLWNVLLQWRHNGCDAVSNYRRLDCLFNRLFRRRSKKTSKLRVTGLCEGLHRWPVNSPNKGPVTRKNVSIWWRHHIVTLTSCWS